jgi:alpha-mannosidase
MASTELVPATEAMPPIPAVFAIPNAHIDPVWIWDWREGLREVVATFEAAADRLDEHEEMYFAASSAAYYEWVETMHPALFQRIKKHVASGRWEIVGGQWIEPDCNLPSGESVCRQLLYAQRYFDHAFGRGATVAYNIDSFGHAASLPQLFAKAGLDAYIMMRPQEHERSLPSPLFLWEGIDGTVLTTFRIHDAYQTGLPSRDEPSVEAEQDLIGSRAAELLTMAERGRIPMMFFVGVGDHGGGPTRIAIDKVRLLNEETEGRIAFGSTARYFQRAGEVRAAGTALPRVRGDLHMHAVGCYSVVAWIKRENAACEAALATAEKMAALAQMVSGVDLGVQAQLRSAWTKVMFNQFHDSLGGTCTEEVCEDLRQFYGYARTVADDITTRATQLVARETDTWIEGAQTAERAQSANPFVAHFPVPIVVFNPLSRPTTAPLVLPHPAAAVTTGDGTSLAVQKVVSREGTRYDRHSLVIAELPALGSRVLWLHREPPSPTDAALLREPDGSTVSAEIDRLANDSLVVEVDRELGRVRSIVSKRTGREWLTDEGLKPVVVDDESDTWSHGLDRFAGAEHECELREVRCVEEGPLRAVIRLTYAWGSSLVYEDLVLHAGLDELEVVLRIDWRQRHELLKLLVPLTMTSPGLRAGVPYGAVERRADGREEVLLHWLHVTETPSGAGVVCSSDVGYAYDLDGGRLRFTVLRSPRYADHGASWVSDDPIDQPATDQGWHQVSYRLRFHDDPRPADTGPIQADEHTATFPYVTETWHRGPQGAEISSIDVSPGNVAVSVVKRAENGAGWVLRVCELAGERTSARVALPYLDRAWGGRLRAFDVVTLFVPDAPEGEIGEVPITELESTGAGRAS